MAKVRLGAKEWKIFQGKTEEGLIYVLAWKRNEKNFQAPHHCRVLENSFLLRPIYLTDRFFPEEGEGRGSKFLQGEKLVSHNGKDIHEGPHCLPGMPGVSHIHLNFSDETAGLHKCELSRKGLAHCKTFWVLWLQPSEYMSFLSRRKTWQFQISFCYNVK